MKKYVLILLGVLFMPCIAVAQSENSDKTLFGEITGMKKETDKFNLYLNMHSGFNARFQDGFQKGAFEMKQLRIEAKGNLNDWLSYHYRQRLNRGNAGNGNIDNLPASIDIAGIGMKLDHRFSVFLGKQSTDYGGIEFDLNPIELYEYADMIEYMSNFMTGVEVTYSPVENHQFQFQILDSRNSSMAETYGESSELEDSKLPLVYTLNWNGNFNNVLKTRWSASVMSETKDRRMYYYALGNELSLGRSRFYFDWMYSREGIDRKSIITSIVGSQNGHNAYDAEYMSFVLHGNYRFLPKWNVFAKGMYETASVSKATTGVEKGRYRTSWGYMGGIEFYPMEQNLHFFLAYIGRSYRYTDRAKASGCDNYDTSRVSLGFIWQLPMF